MAGQYEIVPEFLVQLVPNAHPVQQHAVRARLERIRNLPSDNIYATEGNAAIKTTKQMLTENWGSATESSGVSVYTRSAGSSACCRGDLVLDMPPAYFLGAALPFGARKVWDANLEHGELKFGTDSVTNVAYMYTKSRVAFSSRDMAVVSRMEVLEDGTIIQAAKSIETKDLPPTKAHVRADLQVSGFVLEPVRRGTRLATKAVYIAQLDLKGWTPGAVLQYVASQTPLALAKIGDFVAKYGPPPFSIRVNGVFCENDFINDKSEYSLVWKHAEPLSTTQVTEFFIPAERYRSGALLTLTPPNAYVASVHRYTGHGVSGAVLRLVDGSVPPGTKVKLVIQPNPARVSSEPQYILNGQHLPLQELTLCHVDVAEYDAAQGASGAAPAPAPSHAVAARTEPAAVAALASGNVPLSETPGGCNLRTDDTPHRFQMLEQELWKRAEGIISGGTSSWTDLGEYKGSRMYQKDVPGNPLGLLMGVRVVDGVTPFEIYSALSTPGVRSVWEKDLYDTSSIKEVLSKRASLVYALFKGFFPVSPRDSALFQTWRWDADGTLWVVGASVTDPAVPPTKNVRSHTDIVLWVIRPIGTPDKPRVESTYLTQTSLGGWIPDRVVKLVAQQIPQAVRYVANYVLEQGAPPFFWQVAGEVEGDPRFDPATNVAKFAYTSKPTAEMDVTVLALPIKRYASGATITVSPPAGVAAVYERTPRAFYVGLRAPAGTKLTVEVQPKTGAAGKGPIRVNGVDAEEQVVSPAALVGKAASVPASAPAANAVPIASAVPSASAALTPSPSDRILSRLDELQERVVALQSQLAALQASTVLAKQVQRRRRVDKWVKLLIMLVAMAILAAWRRH